MMNDPEFAVIESTSASSRRTSSEILYAILKE